MCCMQYVHTTYNHTQTPLPSQTSCCLSSDISVACQSLAAATRACFIRSSFAWISRLARAMFYKRWATLMQYNINCGFPIKKELRYDPQSEHLFRAWTLLSGIAQRVLPHRWVTSTPTHLSLKLRFCFLSFSCNSRFFASRADDTWRGSSKLYCPTKDN